MHWNARGKRLQHVEPLGFAVGCGHRKDVELLEEVGKVAMSFQGGGADYL